MVITINLSTHCDQELRIIRFCKAVSEDGQHPLVIQLWMQEEISLETVVILNSLIGFIPRESKKISDTLIWPDIKRKIEKYSPFVNFNSTKCKLILLEGFTNNA